MRGFLPSADPLERLPAGFECWEELAADLPKVVCAGRIHSAIAALPELSPTDLADGPELDRAMLLLSYFGHTYVFGDDEPRSTIPANLARPWYQVAARLGRPPVLSYASHSLVNWRRFDRGLPIELGNIARLENIVGGMDDDWFVLVHVAIESAAGAGVAAAVQAQDAAEHDDLEGLAKHLDALGDVMERMLGTLRRMPEHCDPYIYYNRVRRYIFGWLDNPALPNGVLYEGVKEYADRPQKFRGETGAQSSVIPAFDAVLGLDYSGDVLGKHMVELRAYMPPRHRVFVEALEERFSVRDYVARNADHKILVAAYNRDVQLTGDFRRQHLEYAGTYIRGQVQTSGANPVQVGTGGTPFMKYLSQHVLDTDRYLIEK
ncbi:indoleamine 2,3-dioxygenase [Frankia sp. AgB32]|nr:indoleamine 2,3-dioxygenase [Frankia sp. AgB32]